METGTIFLKNAELTNVKLTNEKMTYEASLSAKKIPQKNFLKSVNYLIHGRLKKKI